MSITTVLFDLDGTLLPMDNDAFTKGYFGFLSAYMKKYGYQPKELVNAVLSGTAAMVKNKGDRSNEAAFWDKFGEIYGEKGISDKHYFDEYYKTDFQKLKEFCGISPSAAETVHSLKERGFTVVLATNPIFPAYATESRIRWAGLDPSDFKLYTTYENIGYCKPNPDYYAEIFKRLGAAPEECIMIGNDAKEDMIAEKLGTSVFLLTDCLINKENTDISRYPKGDFTDLAEYLKAL
ncbi:MAG: HAD family hydrolase [Firmicutes bacterium]|nr:HAD family hydrolase [[Eubacterium] siraeum]MCM1488004.1 HAD family hydrolase [Bacillota bacterium]